MLEIRFTEEQYERLLGKVDIENAETVEPILRNFFVRGLSRKEVAEKSEVSRSYVSRQLKQFIAQISKLQLEDIQITLSAGDSEITLTGRTEVNEDRKT